MTTIAFDGKTLAADLQATQGNRRIRLKTKLHRLKNGSICGGCGDAIRLLQFVDWLNDTDELPEIPIIGENEDSGPESIEVLVVQPSGRLFIYNGLGVPLELDEKKYAIGSGSDWALAAMENGKSAKEAVTYAQTRDNASGFGVETLDLALPHAPVKKRVRRRTS